MREDSVAADLDCGRYETVLLDMDGTVLDLAFDNYFWRELVPRCVAGLWQIDGEVAREEVFARYASKEGSLEWYCLDYWTDELGLDLIELKAAASHRIRFLPGAKEFLGWAANQRLRLVLVTNAHAETLGVKKAVSGLELYIGEFVSSHDLGYPKEDQRFWEGLREQLQFDPESTLFIDDSLAVLDAAADFGLQSLVAVTCPDSRQPARDIRKYPSVPGIGSLVRAG